MKYILLAIALSGCTLALEDNREFVSEERYKLEQAQIAGALQQQAQAIQQIGQAVQQMRDAKAGGTK